MKIRLPEIYRHFQCLAGDCPQTCCAGWEVVVDNASRHLFETASGTIGKRLRAAMVTDSDGDTIFKNFEGHCPFLNAQNLCDIYTALGEDALCHTCKSYPRFINRYSTLKEYGLSLSCPEAARMILTDTKPMAFIETTTTDSPVSDTAPDPIIFDRLLCARQRGIAILQNRGYSFIKRLRILSDFIIAFSAHLFDADNRSCEKLCADYNEAMPLGVSSRNQAVDPTPLSKIIETLLSLEHLKPDFPALLTAATTLKDSDLDAFYHIMEDPKYSIPFEQLSVYTLYRYFLDAAWTCEPLIQLQQLLFSCLAHLILGATIWKQQNEQLSQKDLIDLMVTFSREIEHSENNMEALEDLFYSDDALSVTALVKRIEKTA